MIKLVDLLKEITEAKQVGDLYHFTPLSNLRNILSTRLLYPNDEKAISTSVRPNMSTRGFQDMQARSIARIMLDGDKISNKYKIRPFAYSGGGDGDHEDLGEEQILTNGEKFPFIPYLKRIDIFLNKKDKVDPKILGLLEKANIPYKVYQGTPISNIPYNQPKTGDPKDIDIEKIPEKKEYTYAELFFPGMEAKKIELYDSKDKIDNGDYPSVYTFYSSPEYPDYYIDVGAADNPMNIAYLNQIYTIKGKKLTYKFIPIPMLKDPKWKKMWKSDQRPLWINSYILMPKKQFD